MSYVKCQELFAKMKFAKFLLINTIKNSKNIKNICDI